jgi:hypothetical protein
MNLTEIHPSITQIGMLTELPDSEIDHMNTRTAGSWQWKAFQDKHGRKIYRAKFASITRWYTLDE